MIEKENIYFYMEFIIIKLKKKEFRSIGYAADLVITPIV